MGFGNLAKMAQQMQADMARVEAELRSCASGHGGRRRGQGGRHRQAGAAVDDHRPGGGRPRRRRDAPGPGAGRRERGARPGQGDRGGRSWAGSPAACSIRACDARPAAPPVTTLVEPVVRLIEALSRLPGIGPKTAQRLTYHLLRAPGCGGALARGGAHRGARRGRVLRPVLQHQHRARVPHLPRPGRDDDAAVRRRGAARRARAGAVRRVPGPLPRAARRHLADGWHRTRPAAHPPAAGSGWPSASTTASRSPRSCWPPTPRWKGRRPRCISPSG